MLTKYSFQGAFNARDDLQIYGDNSLLLFALELKWNIDDIDTVASEALTDGPDDKKCDLVYVDTDLRAAVIAQGFMTNPEVERFAAPANKAADLNVAVTWLLSRNIEELPERLQSAATALRSALNAHEIETIEIWYVHNCPESANVASELATVELAARNAVKTGYPESKCDDIRAIEVGINILEEWYSSTRAPILVNNEFWLEVPGGYELSTTEWRAFTTAVPAYWIYEIYRDHQKKLFSGNLRDYLGSRKSDENINHGIKDSAANSPMNFWVFNNGITALVHSFELAEDLQSIHIHGISIVNGAQTTGAIGSLKRPPSESAHVPARFIECSDPGVIQDIVRYTNSQNKVAPADFRSTDSVQDRLRKEFEYKFPLITYLGGRRGGTEDAIRRRQGHNYIPSDTIAQALTAFHHNPVLAYNRKSEIWESDENYSRVFNENTHAEHLIFVYSLLRAINTVKRSKSSNVNELTDADQKVLQFLRDRGSIIVLIAAIGRCVEIIIQRPIPNKFMLRFSNIPILSGAEALWLPIVESCISFTPSLHPALSNGLKNLEEARKAIDAFQTWIHHSASSNVHSETYKSFAEQVLLSPWSASNPIPRNAR